MLPIKKTKTTTTKIILMSIYLKKLNDHN